MHALHKYFIALKHHSVFLEHNTLPLFLELEMLIRICVLSSYNEKEKKTKKYSNKNKHSNKKAFI